VAERHSVGQADQVRRTAKRIALLHLSPALSQVGENREVIERGTRLAATLGADWVLSGELVVPGFHFEPMIGTDRIVEEPSQWLLSYATLAKELGLSVFINHPEREGERCFNTLFAFDATGALCGRHRKLCVTPIVEAWSTPGEDIRPVIVDDVSVGLLVCAYPPEITTHLNTLGAEVLLSSAAWHPGEWGPSGEWEARSSETQLPLIVCNRTGVEADVSFLDSESVLVEAGRRVETLKSNSSTVFVVDLNLASKGSNLTLVGRYPIP
jgi:predicted amidohydrolase